MPDLPDILARIVEAKRRRIELVSGDFSRIRSGALSAPSALDFRCALSGPRLSIIAEIKKASPAAGIIVENFEPAKFAKGYYEAGADAISVLTEEDFFLGASVDLQSAKAAAPQIPILRKDFIFSEIQVYESRMIGADSFLLICAILDRRELADFILLGRSLGMEALVEAHDRAEVEKAANAGAKIIGINNRDLRTFKASLAVSAKLSGVIPDGITKVSESGIKNASDCRRLREAGFDAALIGEKFMKAGIANFANTMRKFKGLKSIH